MAVTFISLRGSELAPRLDDLGQLRITVFREFPYLYDGTLEYERKYLEAYLRSAASLVVLALDEKRVVGATTCLPLADEGPEFQEPFVRAGYRTDSICYFGESILLPEYRGQGIGRLFFEFRETHARSLPGIEMAAFCAVDRADDHPLRPPSYQLLDDFWLRRGFQKHPELRARFLWKEVGELNETPKTLTFWMKSWKEQ